MINKEIFIGLFIALFVITSGWLWLSPDGIKQAPDVTFRITDGRQITLQEMRGKAVLVTFWATSCPGCIKEMPHLITLYNELSSEGLEIVGVAMAHDPPNRVMKMIQQREIPYPIALDIDGDIAQEFGDVRLTPTSFLIAPDGTIVKHKVGEMDIHHLSEQIQQLLNNQIARNPKDIRNYSS